MTRCCKSIYFFASSISSSSPLLESNRTLDKLQSIKIVWVIRGLSLITQENSLVITSLELVILKHQLYKKVRNLMLVIN